MQERTGKDDSVQVGTTNCDVMRNGKKSQCDKFTSSISRKKFHQTEMPSLMTTNKRSTIKNASEELLEIGFIKSISTLASISKKYRSALIT